MRIKLFYTSLFFLFILISNIYSQENCTVPSPPVLTLVSVQPETGNIEFTWTPSDSSDISAYLLYTFYNEGGIPRGNIIDTIWNPFATSYSYANSFYKYHSSSFVVSAYRSPKIPGLEGCPSPFSNILNTIFTTSVLDTCNKKIIVSWNSYPSYPARVTGYSILLSVNGSSFTEEVSVSPETGSFTFENFETDAEYCYVVRANLEGGTFSTSNKSCLQTKMLRPPQWINADYATIDAGKLSLSFTVDPSSEISHFQLEKKTKSTDFQIITNINTDDNQILYVDNQAELTTVNTYRLSAVNSCNNKVTISNECSNIVVSMERGADEIFLSWNSYKKWLGEVYSYRVFISTGSDFEEKAELPPTDTTYTMMYDEVMYDVTGSELCFYISATEKSNPFGITGQSNSSVLCTEPTEIITVPNVFTPNNDLVNDFFRPVLSFTPQKYHLVISDRRGKIIFETNDHLEEWDGSQRGNTNADAVCLWFLETTTPSGKSISKTGTVTIIKSVK
jgi:gliding motility-associated-like protein